VNRAILHVDMDAFYASVEQRDDPRLAGLPVVVGGRGARGVVAAASYEARRHGLRSAMPMRRALELCPEAIVVPPRMRRYREVSRQVFAIFHDYTPVVEGLSLDEAFLDVTASLQLHGTPESIAARIKSRIHDELGLTASIGVATNRLVAKIASDIDKPDGLTLVPPERVQEVLDPLPVSRLPGLGRLKGEAVRAAGITTLGQLRRADDRTLWPLFGARSQLMRSRAAGIDDRPISPEREELSISAEETFDTDLQDPAQLHALLLDLADRATARLRRTGLAAGVVSVKIRRADFRTFSRQLPLRPPGADSGVISRTAQGLLAAWLREHPGAALRLVGIGLSDLGKSAQLDLISGLDSTPAAPIDPVVDRIRERFGDRAIFRAGTGASADGGERHKSLELPVRHRPRQPS
jgi:DNA polymerase IV